MDCEFFRPFAKHRSKVVMSTMFVLCCLLLSWLLLLFLDWISSVCALKIIQARETSAKRWEWKRDIFCFWSEDRKKNRHRKKFLLVLSIYWLQSLISFNPKIHWKIRRKLGNVQRNELRFCCGCPRLIILWILRSSLYRHIRNAPISTEIEHKSKNEHLNKTFGFATFTWILSFFHFTPLNIIKLRHLYCFWVFCCIFFLYTLKYNIKTIRFVCLFD